MRFNRFNNRQSKIKITGAIISSVIIMSVFSCLWFSATAEDAEDHIHIFSDSVTYNGDGTHTGICSVCGQTITEKCTGRGRTLGVATCTRKGKVSFKCEVCATSQVSETNYDKSNHSGSPSVIINRKSATCAEEGYTGDVYWSCCGEMAAEGYAIPKLTLHQWDYGRTTVPPTCKTTGKKEYTCKLCGTTKESTINIDPSNHSGQANIVRDARAATCTATGYSGDTYWNCCGAIAKEGKVLAVDSSNHSGTAVVLNAKEATCAENGYTGDIYWTCCDTLVEKGDETLKLGTHDWDEGVVSSEPTCTTYGVMTYTCSVCQIKRNSRIPFNSENHEGTPDILVGDIKATCAREGYSGDVCWSCCYELVEEGSVTPKLTEHEWDNGTIVMSKTCTSDGLKVYQCPVCRATKEEVIKACHEPLTKVAAVTATCYENGNIAFYVCASCGELFADANGKVKIKLEDTIIRKSHIDTNHDDYCDLCGEDLMPPAEQEGCDCICHKTDLISKIICKIILIIWRIFGVNKTCECGAVHY